MQISDINQNTDVQLKTTGTVANSLVRDPDESKHMSVN